MASKKRKNNVFMGNRYGILRINLTRDSQYLYCNINDCVDENESFPHPFLVSDCDWPGVEKKIEEPE